MSAAVSTERAWFLTLTGRQFFYDEPEAYPYAIEEIAHAHSFDCRFGGHLARFYSVCEHAVLVAQTVRSIVGVDAGDRLLRAALLHDASESFLRDIPRPQKKLPEMEGYRALEDRVQRAILRAFGLEDLHDHPVIKRADAAMLQAEKLALRPRSPFRQEYDDRECSSAFIASLAPEEARELFLAMWGTYGG